MLSKNLADKVRQCLIDYPDLRDDDMYLLSMVWRSEIGEEAHAKSCFVVLGMIARHEVSNFESVRRIRQKIQEEDPNLRGKLWGKRHKYAEKEFVQEVNQIGKHVSPQGDFFG